MDRLESSKRAKFRDLAFPTIREEGTISILDGTSSEDSGSKNRTKAMSMSIRFRGRRPIEGERAGLGIGTLHSGRPKRRGIPIPRYYV